MEPLNSVPAFKNLCSMDPNLCLTVSGLNQEGSSTLEESLNQEQLLCIEDGEPGDSLLSLYTLTDLSVSPGYRFAPKDHELINDYLKKKINNEPAPYIRGCSITNVYKYSPWELTELYPSLDHNEWYFFTQRNQMDLFWKRPIRVAGNGYWKVYGTEKQIYHKNICIGSKKSLIFYKGKPPKVKKTNWVMKEYEVDQPSMQQKDARNMLLDDCVLFRIHLKRHLSSRNKKEVAACRTKKQKTNKFSENENHAAHKCECVAVEHQGTTSLQSRCYSQILESTTIPARDTNIVTSL